MDPSRAMIFPLDNVTYEYVHSGDAPPSQNFSVSFQFYFMHACVCSTTVVEVKTKPPTRIIIIVWCSHTLFEMGVATADYPMPAFYL